MEGDVTPSKFFLFLRRKYNMEKKVFNNGIVIIKWNETERNELAELHDHLPLNRMLEVLDAADEQLYTDATLVEITAIDDPNSINSDLLRESIMEFDMFLGKSLEKPIIVYLNLDLPENIAERYAFNYATIIGQITEDLNSDEYIRSIGWRDLETNGSDATHYHVIFHSHITGLVNVVRFVNAVNNLSKADTPYKYLKDVIVRNTTHSGKAVCEVEIDYRRNI